MGFLSKVLGTNNNFNAAGHNAMDQGLLHQGVQPVAQANLGAPVSTFGQANVGRGAGLDLSNYGNTIHAVQGQVQGHGGPAQDTIQRQGMLADQLQASANGQGPSPAEEMLRRATSANANAAAGAAASARGINPALAARMGVDAAASANQQAAGQAAELRAKERIAARDQMAGVLQGRAGNQLGQQGVGVQALGTAGGLQNAQNANQIANTLGAQDLQLRDALGTNALNLQGSLGQQGLNLNNAIQTGRLNLDQSLGQQGLNLANFQGAEKLNLGKDAINAGVASGNQQQSGQIVGGLLSGAGAGVSALSDERAKADVHRMQTEALPGVPHATFRYKGEPKGTEHKGVIAQDVEKVRPDLVGRTSGGMRTVPAGLMQYARGGEVEGGNAPEQRSAAPAQAPTSMGLPANGSMYGSGVAAPPPTMRPPTPVGGLFAGQPGPLMGASFSSVPATTPAPTAAPAPQMGGAFGSSTAGTPAPGSFGQLGSTIGSFQAMRPQQPATPSMFGGIGTQMQPQSNNMAPPLLQFAYGGPMAAPDDEYTGIVDAPYTGAMARPKEGNNSLHDYLNVLHGSGMNGEHVMSAGAPAAAAAGGGGAGAAVGAGMQSMGGNMQHGSGGSDQIGHYMSLAHSSMYANGGRVPAMVSPQEVVVPPSAAHSPKAAAAMVASGEGKVPGKGKVSGDSPKNDTVKASLSPGSVVIPRSITQGENAPERAASFVASVMRRSGGQKLHSGGYLAEKAGPGPSSHADYSEGGYVEADPVGKANKKAGTARGLGRDETRRRIKASSGPMKEED